MATPITIATPDTTEMEGLGSSIIKGAKLFVVDDDSSCAEVVIMQRRCKTLERQATDLLAPAVKAAHQAHKAIKATQNELAGVPKMAWIILNTKRLDYSVEQQRKRDAKEKRLRAEAQRVAEESQLAEAAELEAAGHNEQAQRVLEAPVTPVSVVLPAPPKAEGIADVRIRRYKITDVSKIPPEYMIPNEKAIGAHGRSAGEAAKIPGVEFYWDVSTRTKGF